MPEKTFILSPTFASLQCSVIANNVTGFSLSSFLPRNCVRGGLAITLAVAIWFSFGPWPSSASGGGLDPSFGDGGKVTMDFFGTGQSVAAMVVQPDGKLIASSAVSSLPDNLPNSSDSTDFGLVRFNRDGSLDTSFGVGGKVTTDFFEFADYPGAGMALQPDGKIILVGSALSVSVSTSESDDTGDFAIARYNRDGSLDASFGNGGRVTTDFQGFADSATSVAIEPGGKIVVAGSTTSASSNSPAGNFDNSDFALVRYNRNGSLDTSFGNGGKVITDFSGFADTVSAMALSANGRIVVAGETRTVGFNYPSTTSADSADFGIACYDRNGNLDTSFGNGGKVITDFSNFADRPTGVALLSNRKVLVTGYTFFAGFAVPAPFDYTGIAMARYNKDGNLDASFGSGGKVTTDFPGSSDLGLALATEPNGTIVIAGGSTPIGGSPESEDFEVIRYNRDGSLDTNGGKVTVDFFGLFDEAYAVAVEPSGVIYVGGIVAGPNDSAVMGIARLEKH